MILCVSVLVAVGLLVPSSTASAAYADQWVSSLTIVSPTGVVRTWSTALGDNVGAVQYRTPGIEVAAGDRPYDASVSIAPRLGESLVVGTYADAGPPYDAPVERERLTVDLDGGSVGRSGSFTILSLPRDPDSLRGIWFTFEVQDDDGDYWFGEARSYLRDPHSELSTSPDVVAWPTTYPHAAATSTSVTVTAQGDDPVTVSGAHISAGASEFRVEGSTCGVLQPRESCRIDVGFTPTSAGPRTGLLVIDDSTPTGEHVVPLRGTGIPGETSWSVETEPDSGYGVEGSATLQPDGYRLTAWGDSARMGFNFYTRNPSPGPQEFASGHLSLTAPRDHHFAAGDTFTTTTWSGSPGPEAMMDLAIGSTVCGNFTGTFTVNEVGYSPRGFLRSADITFSSQCTGLTGRATGEVRWRAQQGDAAPPPPGDDEAPAPISNLHVATDNGHAFDLAWDDSASSDWSEVIVRAAEGSVAPTSPDEGVLVYRGREARADVDDLAMQGTWSFAVFPVDAAGNVGPADTLTVPDIVPPHPVDNLFVDVHEPDVTLTWTGPTAPDWDHTVVSISRAGADPMTQTINVGREHEAVVPLPDGSAWTIAVQSVDTSGNVSDPLATQTRPSSAVQNAPSPQVVRCGDNASVEGVLEPRGQSDPTWGNYMDLERQSPDGTWAKVAPAFTGYGAFQYRVAPCRTTAYRVHYPGAGLHMWTISSPVTVEVQPALDLAAAQTSVRIGHLVHMTARARPLAISTPLRLQARTSRGWQTIKHRRVDADGLARFAVRLRRSTAFRVLVPTSDEWVAATTDAVKVRAIVTR